MIILHVFTVSTFLFIWGEPMLSSSSTSYIVASTSCTLRGHVVELCLNMIDT